MNRYACNLFLAGTMLFLLAALGARADSVKMSSPPGSHYEKRLGSGAIADPTGKIHTRAEVKGKVVLILFSAPNMSQGNVQEKWSKLLADDPKTKVDDRVVLALFEDMTQAGMFKGIALDDMKKDFTPDSRPIVGIDQTGEFFKHFGIPRDTTQILIYDKQSKLRDVDPDLSDESTVTHRVKVITNKLLAE
jgi:hypothetical protein